MARVVSLHVVPRLVVRLWVPSNRLVQLFVMYLLIRCLLVLGMGEVLNSRSRLIDRAGRIPLEFFLSALLFNAAPVNAVREQLILDFSLLHGRLLLFLCFKNLNSLYLRFESLEPAVLLNLLECIPAIGVDLEDVADQVLAIIGYIIRIRYLAV